MDIPSGRQKFWIHKLVANPYTTNNRGKANHLIFQNA